MNLQEVKSFVKVMQFTKWQSQDSGPVSPVSYSLCSRMTIAHFFPNTRHIKGSFISRMLLLTSQQSWEVVLLSHITGERWCTHDLTYKEHTECLHSGCFASHPVYFLDLFLLHSSPWRASLNKNRHKTFPNLALCIRGWSVGWPFYLPMTEEESQGQCPLVGSSCIPWNKYSDSGVSLRTFSFSCQYGADSGWSLPVRTCWAHEKDSGMVMAMSRGPLSDSNVEAFPVSYPLS